MQRYYLPSNAFVNHIYCGFLLLSGLCQCVVLMTSKFIWVLFVLVLIIISVSELELGGICQVAKILLLREHMQLNQENNNKSFDISFIFWFPMGLEIVLRHLLRSKAFLTFKDKLPTMLLSGVACKYK